VAGRRLGGAAAVSDPGVPGRPRPEVAVGAIAVRDGALLLVRRGRPPEAGRWSLPGGRLEAGETLRAAVEREVLEETGLEARCGELVGWVERMGPAHHFVILDFAVTVEPGRPQAGGDAAEVAWVPLGELGRVELVSGLAEFLADHQVR
jgi:8-oxo-dGTP diphosphatase